MTAKLFGIENSLKGQKWIAPNYDINEYNNYKRQNLSDIEARILSLRKFPIEKIEDLLNPKLKTQMPDPNCLLNMDLAVQAIIEAIDKNSQITIFADYDVDGGTSAAILTTWFNHIGVNTNIFVPDRIKDGYGPSPQLMRAIKEKGTDLLISVDCGAAAHSALEEAFKIGLDVVVFDHHLMQGDIPPSKAIVNPNNPKDTSGLGNLTAAGVCFMAIVALDREWRRLGRTNNNFSAMELLDLVALGTICDVAPLTDLNRVFVAQGQKILGKLPRAGLAALSSVAGLKKAGNVFAAAWVFGPRLNAGGRIGDSSLTVRLLTTNDEAEAHNLSLQLETLNAERRAIEAGIIEEAIMQIESGKAGDKNNAVLLLGAKGWHPGILGIVAGRMKERYNRPCIIIGSVNIDDEIAKGSGRSIEGVNLGMAVKALVDKGIIHSGGGHAMAAGLSMNFSDIEIVREEINRLVESDTFSALETQSQSIDAIVSCSSISIDILDSLDRLGPFGTGWQEPLFCVANARIIKIDTLNGGHLRIVFTDDSDVTIAGICFGAMGTKLGEGILSKRKLHLIIRLKRDEWRGSNTVQAEIIDACYAFDAVEHLH